MRNTFSKTTALLVLLAALPRCYAQTDYLAHRLAKLTAARNLYNDGMQENFRILKDYLQPKHLRKLVNTRLHITLDDKIISAAAYGHTNSIHISAATILFLEELATTLAWYDSTGNKNCQPIRNYVLLLRRNMRTERLQRRTIPSMTDILGVPSDKIWKRPDTDPVKSSAQNFLKTTVIWILAHEMGHIALGHLDKQTGFPNYLEKARHDRKLEIAADEFATILMSRVNLAPIGMVATFEYYSLLYPVRSDYDNEKDWQSYLANESHPVWPERLEALAKLFRKYGRDSFNTSATFHACAQILEEYAKLLKTKNMLDVMILFSKDLTWENIMTFEPSENIGR